MYKTLFILFFYFLSLKVWSLDVNQTIKSTVENNSKIKIGLEQINEAKELISIASGELLPNVSAKITGTYETNEKKIFYFYS